MPEPISRRAFLALSAAAPAAALALSAAAAAAARLRLPGDRSPVGRVYAASPGLRAIRDRAERGRPIDPRVRHLLSHGERVALATALAGVPGGRDEIHRVLRHCPDYDRAVTDRHLRAIGAGRAA